MKYFVAVPLLVLLLTPAFARAWGGDGHQIVCLIAEDRLTPSAKAGIHDLLGKDINISDADVASWADQLRRERPEASPWHYVDIPTDAPAFDETRDGNGRNNVIDKIGDFTAVLKDPKATHAARAEALKFLVHFLGDIHQPLHCAERNKDRGGNARLVFFLDEPKAINLHFVWDTRILLLRKGTTPIAEFADKLNAKISAEQAAAWSKGSAVDWANESHAIAVKNVYADIPVDGPPPRVDQKYIDGNGPVIDQQLQKGGVRLAMILNDIFAPAAPAK